MLLTPSKLASIFSFPGRDLASGGIGRSNFGGAGFWGNFILFSIHKLVHFILGVAKLKS